MSVVDVELSDQIDDIVQCVDSDDRRETIRNRACCGQVTFARHHSTLAPAAHSRDCWAATEPLWLIRAVFDEREAVPGRITVQGVYARATWHHDHVRGL